jgi:1,4-dihydroxy-2-naphthoate octaprenyltransferase
MWNYIVYSLRIRRVEYRIAELPIFLIPVFLTITDTSELLSVPFWEGLCVFFFLFAFGDLLNCLADRELDAIYKPQLTEAVQGIGIRGVVGQSAFSAIFALALTTHLSWQMNRWLLIPLVICGLVLAWAYSVEPIRLKGRGVWQIVFYWFGLFTGPMLFTTMLFVPWPAWETTLVCVSFGMAQTGTILLNTAEDFSEDRQSGVNTVIVAVGLQRGMLLALIMTALGGALSVIAFSLLCVKYDDAWGVLAVAPLAITVLTAVVVFARLTLRLRLVNETQAISVVKQAARLAPVWITANAIAALLAAIRVFSLVSAAARSSDGI